jgi:hypothetical protein
MRRRQPKTVNWHVSPIIEGIRRPWKWYILKKTYDREGGWIMTSYEDYRTNIYIAVDLRLQEKNVKVGRWKRISGRILAGVFLQNRRKQATKNPSTELLSTDGSFVASTSVNHKTEMANNSNTTVDTLVHISTFPF